jgi:hypothetical protein
MSANSKIKWLVSTFLAGTLLSLALVGGRWGTSYAAEPGINAAPTITSIDPSAVSAGSPDKVMIIIGTNFGSADDTRVWLSDGVNVSLTPITVLSTGISVTIPQSYLVLPKTYSIQVIVHIPPHTVPTIPTIPNPPDVSVSNGVPFTVYQPLFIYCPKTYK